MPTLREGDFGTVIRITITEDGSSIDISSATALQMLFKKPSGTIVTKTALFDSNGSDGKIKYTVEEGVLDERGKWYVQPRLIMPGFNGRGASNSFDVEEAFGV